MTVLSQSQMMMYASAAGLPNPSLWAAIGEAESSGRTDAVNSIGCVGIWQINQPVWVKTYPQWSVDWLKDPMHNAQAAKVIYNAQGLGAWEAYTNGAYKKYYSGSVSTGATATQAGWLQDFEKGFSNGWNFNFGQEGQDLQQQYDESAAGQITNALGGLGQISDRIGAASAWLGNPHNWLRVAYVAIGGLVVLVGIGGILRPVVQPVASTATKAFPAGRIASAVKKGAK
jgi:hypothetical protein